MEWRSRLVEQTTIKALPKIVYQAFKREKEKWDIIPLICFKFHLHQEYHLGILNLMEF